MSTTQQDILSDPTKLKTQGSPATNKTYERSDNIIAFHNEKIPYKSPTPVGEAFHGLAKMGYRVLVVNAHADSTRGRQHPIEIALPKSYKGTVHLWNHQKGLQHFGDCLQKFSEEFDYVLVDAVHTSRKEMSVLGMMLARLIVSQHEYEGSWFDNPEITNRTFMITSQARPPFLYMNAIGAPEGFVKEGYWESSGSIPVPKKVKFPLIASCHPGLDQVAFASAILGIGDPRRVFVTRKYTNSKAALYRYAYIENWTAYMIGAGGMGVSVMSLPLFALTPQVSLIPLLFTSVVLGAVPMLRRCFRKGHPNILPARLKNLYALHNNDNVPAIAPFIGGSDLATDTPENGATTGTASWQKAEQMYFNIKSKWVDYELDVFKTLDAPLMIDYSCPETQALAKAMQRAQKAMLEAENANGTHADRLRKDFTEKVDTLEIAFKIAEDNALRKGLSYLENSEQSKVQQARKLLMLAKDTGASESEREVSYTQAMKNLQGIIVVSSKTQQRVLELSGLRKEIVRH
jgi:hypothetical protein